MSNNKNPKKNAAETAEAMEKALEMVKSKLGPQWKAILGIVAAAIVLFIALMSMGGSSVSSAVTKEMESIKADLVKLEARVSETEKGSIDSDAVKEDIASIKKAAADFENKLAALVKAEEEKLTRLEKEVETQKVYVDGLKSLLEGAAE
jgi:cell division protein FtsL